MEEILCSLHNYTKFSGYPYSFYNMAQSALDCGLDAVITTDKNIYPVGHNQYYYRSEKKLLVICGEELYDPLNPDSQHYLSIGIDQEQFNKNIRNSQDEILILSDVKSAGIKSRYYELINAEDILRNGLKYSLPAIRKKIEDFDNLLLSDQRCIGLAGTCSADFQAKNTYSELFSTACNHLLINESFSGDLYHDTFILYKAIKNGNLFFSLDGLMDSKGFRFLAEGNNQDSVALPGDTIYLRNSITLKIRIPETCTCRLIHNGKVMKEWRQCKQIPFVIYDPGYYRVECSIQVRRELYDWIFTNPIYVRKG